MRKSKKNKLLRDRQLRETLLALDDQIDLCWLRIQRITAQIHQLDNMESDDPVIKSDMVKLIKQKVALDNELQGHLRQTFTGESVQ